MRQADTLAPFLIALAGVAMLSLMDAFMKEAALAVGAFSAALLRAVIATAIAAPLWLARRTPWPDAATLRLHVLRGVCSALMGLTFFYALTKLPIAETIAISFVAPLIALYLAAILLGERVSRRAVLASLVSFAGTLVIVGARLGRGRMNDDAWLGLAAILTSTVLYALNFIIIRQQSQRAGPLEVAAFHGGVSALVLGVAAPWFFVAPPLSIQPDLLAAGALTVGGAMAIAWAYARAEAQALLPVEYSGFCWAALFGWLFFAESVSTGTLIGVVLIVIGTYIAATRGDAPARAAGGADTAAP
ncbi:DMT family transporter [Alteriqipengyuania lutimaris]|uniref:DMT family transporter n=1 Tax=Alteriqipengyuania lutimaris TaxID=1538146 RepID=A0A395LHG0_9SPHN|nr:DMT family transporter [Alteriqipengyuania lutimaris]MBB3034799.1 S-adenosylmethionine uptake transporter [Alteriqipengyuania lutimaris]RDS76356.1 DMT family transporter [Alteriqipengyuania lutimaris]